MRPVVIVDGIRTPFVRAGAALETVPAQELGRVALREILDRAAIEPHQLDEVIVGNVAQPAEATNIARVIAVNAGVPDRVPAYTVNRSCASGLQALADAALRIATGQAELIAAGGAESMSSMPVSYPESFKRKLFALDRARSAPGRVLKASRFRPQDLRPISALESSLTDEISGLSTGQASEVLAKEFGISREAQDRFALQSHERALAAQEKGIMAEEIAPVPIPPRYEALAVEDQGPHRSQSLDALARLKPCFDRKFGTVTLGNSCPVADGAAMLLLASEEKAHELGLPALGRLRSWAFTGVDPARMGLGPVLATPMALKRAGLKLREIELIEFNETSAAQVLACAQAFDSGEFARKNLGLPEPVGQLDLGRTNVNGGAIALGHAMGATGARLALTLLREMRRRNVGFGLVTLGVGGGQGAAMIFERAT